MALTVPLFPGKKWDWDWGMEETVDKEMSRMTKNLRRNNQPS